MKDSKIDPAFFDRVHKVLNSRFQLALQGPGISVIKGIRFQYDLLDRDNGAFVELIVSGDAISRAKVKQKVNEILGKIPKITKTSPAQLFLVFQETLSNIDHAYFEKSFASTDKIKIRILDSDDILKLGEALKYGNPAVEKAEEYPEETKRWTETFDERMSTNRLGNFSGNFWWLNADQENWPIEEAELGKGYSYPKFTKGKTRRGFNNIEIGDIVISYQKSPFRRLAGIYQVAEITAKKIVFQFVHVLPTIITWGELNELPFFKESTIAKVKATGSIFALDADFFLNLISRTTNDAVLVEAIEEYGLGLDKENFLFEERSTDDDLVVKSTPVDEKEEPDYVRSEPIATDHGTEDSLDFERDAQSLAALIALEEMEPPLAIALFGKWGSGKSFFMECIENNARTLSEDQAFPRKGESLVGSSSLPKKKLFLEGIAHIKFNAWSYLDANLWAGLAHSLFEKLTEYITENSKGELERLRMQLKISQRLKILHSDLNDYKEKKDQLQLLKDELEKEKEREILRFFNGSYDAAVMRFLSDSGLSEEEASKLVPSKLRGYVQDSVRFWQYLKRRWVQVIGITVGIGALCVVGGSYVEAIDIEHYSVGVLAILSPVVTKVLQFFRSKKKTLQTLKGYIDLIEQPKSTEERTAELSAVHQKIEEVDTLISEVEDTIEREQTNSTNVSQLAVANFITTRPDHEDYKKHLGIITTIRKDFETLSELFYTKAPKSETESLSQDRETIKKGFKESKKLERIVLYIDDLDRCSDDKVLEVLQAVHLLMAFPLFIVFVGVDERCVHNALTYRQLERYRGIDKELVKAKILEIEPREYLEKIFQIPFQLPTATPENIENLIESIIPDQEEADEIAETDLNTFEETSVPYKLRSSRTETAVHEDVQHSENPAEEAPEAEEPIEQEDEKTQEENFVQPEKISISDFEKEYLKKLSVLVGKNPRTIKRFVNITRIVKTHENGAFKSKQDTVNILFLIAFVIGEHQKEAIAILKSGSDSPLWSILGRDHKELIELFKDFYVSDELLKKTLIMSPKDFEVPLGFVERFSYKTALKKDELEKEKEQK